MRDRIAQFLARHLPKRIAYWSYIQVGVAHIEGSEIVPEVSYIDVLDRFGKAVRS